MQIDDEDPGFRREGLQTCGIFDEDGVDFGRKNSSALESAIVHQGGYVRGGQNCAHETRSWVRYKYETGGPVSVTRNQQRILHRTRL